VLLGTDAILLPTQAEQVVRTQMALRQEKHNQDNAARALTKEQKHEKLAKKLTKGTDLEVHVTVYRYDSHPQCWRVLVGHSPSPAANIFHGDLPVTFESTDSFSSVFPTTHLTSMKS
jgi:hypothetical protein